MTTDQFELFPHSDVVSAPEPLAVSGSSDDSGLPWLADSERAGPTVLDRVSEVLARSRSALVLVDGRGELPIRMLEASSGLSLQLVVVLRPGQQLSDELMSLADSRNTQGDVVRLLLADWGERYPDAVVLSRGSESNVALTVAAGSIEGASPAASGFTLLVDDELAFHVQEWFVRLWDVATDLSSDTPRVPLQPQAPAPEAMRLWEEFQALMRANDANFEEDLAPDSLLTDPLSPAASEDVASEDVDLPSEPTGIEDDADPTRSVVGIRRPPEIHREISALYGRGRLVTVSSTRVPQFRLNIADVLELRPVSSWGRVTARSAIYVDLLNEEARRSVDRMVGEAGRILEWHSFKIAPQQRWMPDAANDSLVKGLASLPAIKHISQLLREDIETYVDREMEALLESLRIVLEQQQLRVPINNAVMTRLRDAAVAYLEDHATVEIKATHSRESLVFLGDGDASYERPRHLLLDVARTTRWRMAHWGSGSRREREGAPLHTLDVVGGDGLLHCEPSAARQARARQQQHQINQLAHESSSQDVCAELLKLLRSTSDR